MLTNQELQSTPPSRYYENLGQAHDDLLRCKDCQRLVTMKRIRKLGSCKCGNKRFAEIVTLTSWERFKIRIGLIRFAHSAKFLAEFPVGLAE